MVSATGAFSDSLAQLEQSWGKPRDSWSGQDWRKAAELLEKSLAIVGMHADTALRLAMDMAGPPSSVANFCRRGRRKKSVGGLVKIKIKQPLLERNKNFKKKTKFGKLEQMCLVAAVSRDGGRTDKERLEALVGRLNPEWRKGRVAQEVRNKWASRLSRAKKGLSDKERELISKWLEKNK